MVRGGSPLFRESLDGRFLLFRKGNEPGIYRVPVGGGGEEKFIHTETPFPLWDVYDEGICYIGNTHGREARGHVP